MILIFLFRQLQTSLYHFDLQVFPPTVGSPHQIPDLPDEFYDLSLFELKAYQASSTRTTQALNNHPLVSRSALDRVNERKILETHPFTRLRFRFPDGSSVERNFKTSDTVEAVYQWLVNCLRGTSTFKLTVGPPPKLLKLTDTILSLNLFPASVVNIIWDKKLTSPVTSFFQADQDCALPSKRVNSPPPQANPKVSSLPKWMKLHK